MPDKILKMALDTGRRLTIIYNRDEQITKREIRVIGIGDHHILAYCYLRNRMRTFKKACILAAVFSERKSA